MLFNAIKNLSNNKKAGILFIGVIVTLIGGYSLVGAQNNTTKSTVVMSNNGNVSQHIAHDFNNRNKTFESKQNEQFNNNGMMLPQNNGEHTKPYLKNSTQNKGEISTQFNRNYQVLSPKDDASSKKGKKFSTRDQSNFNKNNE